VAPALALIAMVWAGVANYATLLGVPPGAVETWALPGAFAVAAVIGIAYGVWLRSARPEVYRGIGLGLETAPAPERPAPFSERAEPADAGPLTGRRVENRLLGFDIPNERRPAGTHRDRRSH
jgi:hypothetical protein